MVPLITTRRVVNHESGSLTDRLSNMSLEDEAADSLHNLPKPKPAILARPDLNPRSSTDPSPSALLSGYLAQTRPTSSHRNRSPYNRSHMRSRSGGSVMNAPQMTRAHSMPNPPTLRLQETTSAPQSSSSSSPSPLRSPARTRSPFQSENPTMAPRSPIPAIHEEKELDFTPRQPPSTTASTSMTNFHRSSSSSLRRQRPASPLPTTGDIRPHSPSPSASGRFNEAYPGLTTLHHSTSTSSISSSMPSTPTSARSRSPSISSLDTIEDAPDLESEAQESERLERLKWLEQGDTGGGRRSLDAPRPSGVGFGFARVSGGGSGSRERKRWSICGGERRGDLDLETIWED